MTVARYTLMTAAIAIGSMALLWPLLARSIGPSARQAALLGAALALANTVAAYALVRWSAGRPVNTFMGAVLGGMIGRMAALLGAVSRALPAFADRAKWTQLMKNGMAKDFSWQRSAREYRKLYLDLTHKHVPAQKG